MGVLAWQALRASQSHQRLADEVLTDYAGLAADVLGRRIAVELNNYRFRPALDALEKSLLEGPGTPGVSLELAEDRGGSIASLVAWTFRHSKTGGLELGAPQKEALRAWLLDRLAAPTEHASAAIEQSGAFATIEGEPVRAVWRRVGQRIVGFVLREEALRQSVPDAVGDRPLLPSSVAGGRVGNSALFLRVVDGRGHELFRSGEAKEAGRVVRRELPVDYAPALKDLVAEAAVTSGAAHQLLTGGLPGSRLPTLAVLMLLNVGLIAAALVLVRRERALVRLRTEFVSRVSHELRTPLTQIRMFAETLRLGRVRSYEERRRSLEVMDREARRLTALVENVLQYSRAERGVVRLEPRSTQIREAVDRAVEELALAVPPETRIQQRVPNGLAATVDPDGLHQVLLNLLDNALKYGPAGQEIIVGAESKDGTVRLWVDDDGPGVAAADRERVWEPFERGDSQIAGSGIGLAVVHDLVAGHGGRCWIEEGRRGGARVIVELPAAQAP